MKIQAENNARQWGAYVAANPYATNYHQYAWRSVIENTFGHETFYLTARDDEKITGILPLVYMKSVLFGKFLISLPFFNYGGLLCDNNEAELALLEETKKLLSRNGASFVELRHTRPCDRELITKQHKVTMLLRLEGDIARQWDIFDSKLRNQIRKAEKNGLSAKVGGAELLDSFYDVLSVNMRDLGTPVYPKCFFENILSEFRQTTKIFTVFLDKKPIASGVGTSFKDIFEIPWAASIHRYRRYCPNDLLYWEAMKFAIESGFKIFDFGRSSPGSGSFEFKKQWGAGPVQLYWQYILASDTTPPDITTTNPKYRLAIELWKRLPVSIANIIGPFIVRCIP